MKDVISRTCYWKNITEKTKKMPVPFHGATGFQRNKREGRELKTFIWGQSIWFLKRLLNFEILNTAYVRFSKKSSYVASDSERCIWHQNLLILMLHD
jgi:hypothetical protein